MSKIPGRLLADLHPNGTVCIVFIATVGGGNETPFTAESLELFVYAPGAGRNGIFGSYVPE
jgi:hypothetical protein